MTDSEEENQHARLWEIDALRGVAIVWMIGFHLTWDLVTFGFVRINMGRAPWSWFPGAIATIFLTLVGISLVISDSKGGTPRPFRRYLLRGAKTFGFALVISLVTYFLFGDDFVVFGILHLIGVSVVAAYPFLPCRRRWLSLPVGIALIAVGNHLNKQIAFHPWLIWLGVNELGRAMVDWYPLLPWFGMVLLGIWLGHTLYRGGQRRFSLPDGSGSPVIRQLAFLGRHSLLIYLAHQPVLVGILFAIEWMSALG
jgi:uncharacterized membrane protein